MIKKEPNTTSNELPQLTESSTPLKYKKGAWDRMTKEKMTDQERVEIVKEYFDQLPKDIKGCFRCPNCQRHINKNYNLKEKIQEFVEELKEEISPPNMYPETMSPFNVKEIINKLAKQKFGEGLLK